MRPFRNSEQQMSPAARYRLKALLRIGDIECNERNVLALREIFTQMHYMDWSPRRQFHRGRPRDKSGDALLEHLYHLWIESRGVPPGVVTSIDGTIRGPFVVFTQAVAAEILADLERARPNTPRTPLRLSLNQLALNSAKVRDRLRAVRRFWQLPSATAE